MSFFRKKAPESEAPPPVIPTAVIGKIEVQASRLARAGFALKQAIESVPGLTEYASKAIIPKVAPLLITQQWERVLAIIAGDAVIGVAFTAAISAMKDTISKGNSNE